MIDETGHPGGATLREHLANERTLLAYIRTGITLTSFGLTLNRFAVFVAELHLGYGDAHWAKSVRHLERLGVAMGMLGVALLGWAAIHFGIVRREIDRGASRPQQTMVWVLTSVVILLSLASVALLIGS